GPHGRHQAGTFPRRSLLSPRGRHDPAPHAGGAGRRSRLAHGLLRPPVRRTLRQEDSRDFGPGARAAARPCLGGERARAPECDRAGRHRGDRRDAAGRAPAGRAAGRRDHPRRPAPGRTPDPGGGGGAAHRPRAGAYQRPDRCGGGEFEDSSQHADAEDEGVRPVTGPPPVRVEKALALMPELEALAPLRALLVSIARPDEATLWSSSGPYLTLGKRGVHPDELRRRMPQAFHRITEHLQALFKAYVEALECQQRADAPRRRVMGRARVGWSGSWACWRGSNATLAPPATTCGGHESASRQPASRMRWPVC